MKKSLIAVAAFAAFGAAQAQTYDGWGEVVGDTLIQVGGSPFSSGIHGPLGAPAIGQAGGTMISLQGIEFLTFQNTHVTSGSHDFEVHQLLAGFVHPGTPPPAPPTTVDMNGLKVPEMENLLDDEDPARNVYFGLATAEIGTSGVYEQQAWYVGDREDFVMPTGNTVYDAAAMLARPDTPGNAPIILTGTLALTYVGANATIASTGTHFTDQYSEHTLEIYSGTVSGSGTFGGTSEYTFDDGDVYLNSDGGLSGRFFGGGSAYNSAVAGIASGSGDIDYVASFGGIEQ